MMSIFGAIRYAWGDLDMHEPAWPKDLGTMKLGFPSQKDVPSTENPLSL